MKEDSQPRTKLGPLSFLAGGGEMGERIRGFDWSRTPVGPPENWPQSLRSAISILLPSRAQIILFWGRDLLTIYNDAYRPVLGAKHPRVLGLPAQESWSEIWQAGLRELLEGVVESGEAYWASDRLFVINRFGYSEETYFDISYDPVRNEAGQIGGVFCIVSETTSRVVGARRLRTLRELGARTEDAARTAEGACQASAAILACNPHDIPFSLIYLLDRDCSTAGLAGSAGLPEGSAAFPPVIRLSTSSGETLAWPLQLVLETNQKQVVAELDRKFGTLPGGDWPEPVHSAVVLPIRESDQARLAGFLIVGVSPRRALDEEYHGFFDLVAAQVATAIANARAYEVERRRAEALAEIDRAKTVFFTNVSHEFRTPLTLMLSPVEELLASGRNDLTPAAANQLEIVNRNGLRLLRLVNSLLDFSRIEAGRVHAKFQPTDLATVTTDLASVFRSACERAGLQLVVDCPNIPVPVYVDREMWEKIVLNLLSNAFKFTFDGEIVLTLRQTETAAELRVRDTGTGILADEMPRIFERFHRVQNSKGRTHEGTGIGLALIQELVKLHGGSISAESELGKGSTFTVTVPLGSVHLPSDQIEHGRYAVQSRTEVISFVEEALRWLPETNPPKSPTSDEPYHAAQGLEKWNGDGKRPHVLVADDNSDMREYISRLLAEHFKVEAVSDGEAALSAARMNTPDLLLIDVMMPRLDGFGLLRAVRADPVLKGVPVIMLSARAGEESRVEGLEAGADDYLVKPFSARELLARVTAHLEMAQLRHKASESLRASEERFRALVNASSDTVYRMSADWNELRYLHGREYIVDIHQPSHTWIEKYIHPDDKEYVVKSIQEAVQSKSIFEVEHRVLRENGTEGWTFSRAVPLFDRNGDIVEWFGMANDITEKRRSEAMLRRQASLLEQTHDSIFVWEFPGRIIYWNRAAEQLYGFSQEEAIGKVTHDLLATVFPQEDRVAFEAVLEEQGEFKGELIHTKKSGEAITVESRIRLLTETDGRRLVLETSRDISDRKAAEEEQRRLLAALSEADRRKDEFLATLAHELRNPLAPIGNALRIVRLSSDPQAKERAQSLMERQLGQLVRLVEDLMDVNRINRGKLDLRKERVSLATVVNSAVETSNPLIERMGHELTVSLPKEPIYLDADLTRLAQVFMNLLNNAAKYTERGGKIRLTASQEGNDAVVSVRDTGIGIPPDKLQSIFGMFAQVDQALEKAQGGLGIGLTLVKRLVEMHGGTVEASSLGRGTGSEFTVRLPAVPSLAAEQNSKSGKATTPSKNQRRILVADDNRDSADSLAMLLETMGYNTKTAYDGLKALELGATFEPDVVLLDIGMPKLNGYETCRCIREQAWGKKAVLIACTGLALDEDKRKSQEAGFNLHMVKPVDPVALMKLLATLKLANG